MSRLLYQAELLRRAAAAAHRGVRRAAVQSPLTESNRRPSPYHGDALPTELRGREPDEDTCSPGAGGTALDRPAAHPNRVMTTPPQAGSVTGPTGLGG